jgi:hypothetical protein
MNEAQRDAMLIDIKIKIAKISTDIGWVKKIIAVVILALAAVFGISLPPGLIE